ncbi:hypothetical protein V9T40_010401 [Parthenolecanium corni]|uniref:Uncharacterized protein n=1 Tax=Parthenolecanium corni TaxID=536013 RepID=A0AAN9TCB1_9HEMI
MFAWAERPAYIIPSCEYKTVDKIICSNVSINGADPNLRDWSGRKPFQYKSMNNRNSSSKMDSIRSKYFVPRKEFVGNASQLTKSNSVKENKSKRSPFNFMNNMRSKRSSLSRSNSIVSLSSFL